MTSRLAHRALVAVLLASMLGAALPGCCFFGPLAQLAPPTVDDPGASAEAERFVREQIEVLARQVSSVPEDPEVDAGPGAPGGCASLATLALQMTVIVLSRGHAGADSAAEVSVNPGACFWNVVVTVVLTGGVWRAVHARAETFDGQFAEVGTEPDYLFQEQVRPALLPPASYTGGGGGGGGSSDHDWGSDEMF